MGFSTFTKFTVKRMRRGGLLAMGLFTKSKAWKAGELLGVEFTKERMPGELLAWVFFTFKSKRSEEHLGLLAFKNSNGRYMSALARAGM